METLVLTLVQLRAALRILAFMFALTNTKGEQLLPRGENDVLFRWSLAQAIVIETENEEERYTLARLAGLEAGFRRNVARCEVLGDHGKSKGEFQVQPMSAADSKDACSGDLRKQVALALRYARRSAEMCPKNQGAAKLHLYVSGHCDYGHKEAVLRWGGQDVETFDDANEKSANENERERN